MGGEWEMKRMGNENLQSDQVPRKWREKGVEGDREFDGRTV